MQPQTVSVMKKCGAGIAEGTGDVIAEIIGTDGGSASAVFYQFCGNNPVNATDPLGLAARNEGAQ